MWKVAGIHVTGLRDSLEDMNRFTLLGKGLSQYFILILAVTFVAFSFYVCGLCIRTKSGMKRWMWISLILVGVGRLTVNWTTGEWYFDVLALQIPCATARADLYGPWMISALFPLGALFFLNEQWRRKVIGKSVDDILPAK